MSIAAVRPAYVLDLTADRIRAHRAMIRVGESPANAPASSTKVDLQSIGLYVGLPAAAAAAGALLLGLGAAWAVGAAIVGGGGGYLYLDHEETVKKKQAAQNAADAAAAAEKTRIASLDIGVVATQSDSIGLAAKAGLSLFSVGFVPGGTGKDYSLASFTSVPTDAVVKQLTDLQKMLSENGYTTAASQIAAAASTAASLRDAGLVMGGTVSAPSPKMAAPDAPSTATFS